MKKWMQTVIAVIVILCTIETSHTYETVELDYIGWTLLHRAAEEGSVEEIDALIFGGHSVDEQITAKRELKRLQDITEDRQNTVLAEINRRSNVMVGRVKKLVDSVKNRDQTYRSRQMLEDTAEVFGKQFQEDMLQYMESWINIMEVQLVEGATALHIAVASRQYDAAKLLIEKGADVNAQTEYGMHPVDFAAIGDELKLLRLMLMHGADPEKPSTEAGLRPLHWAVLGNALQTTRELLKRGVDVNATTTSETEATAMDVANQLSSEAFLLQEMLKQHGGQCAKNC